MREFNESGGAFGIIHKNLDKYPKYTEAINSEEAKENTGYLLRRR